MKRHDAERFDDVADSAARKEIVRQRSFGGVNTLGSANLLDQESQRAIDEALINPASPDARRQSHLAQLTRDACSKPSYRSNNSLGQRQNVPLHYFHGVTLTAMSCATFHCPPT